MDRLNELINKRLNNYNMNISARAAEVIFFSNQLLANHLPDIKPPACAYRFKDGIIFISVKHSTVGQEVWGLQEKLLYDLKKRFGEQNIKKICIKSLTIP